MNATMGYSESHRLGIYKYCTEIDRRLLDHAQLAVSSRAACVIQNPAAWAAAAAVLPWQPDQDFAQGQRERTACLGTAPPRCTTQSVRRASSVTAAAAVAAPAAFAAAAAASGPWHSESNRAPTPQHARPFLSVWSPWEYGGRRQRPPRLGTPFRHLLWLFCVHIGSIRQLCSVQPYNDAHAPCRSLLHCGCVPFCVPYWPHGGGTDFQYGRRVRGALYPPHRHRVACRAAADAVRDHVG